MLLPHRALPWQHQVVGVSHDSTRAAGHSQPEFLVVGLPSWRLQALEVARRLQNSLQFRSGSGAPPAGGQEHSERAESLLACSPLGSCSAAALLLRDVSVTKERPLMK